MLGGWKEGGTREMVRDKIFVTLLKLLPRKFSTEKIDSNLTAMSGVSALRIVTHKTLE